MYLVHLSMVRADDRVDGSPTDDAPVRANAAAMEANAVHDVLWAHARPEHGLEHIRARPAPHGVDLVLFITAAETEHAEAKVAALLESARGAEALSRYTAPEPEG